MKKGPFIYRGTVESLAKQVEEHRNAINQRYLEILGREKYDRLTEIADRILVPEAFFNSVGEMKERLEIDLPENTASKHIFPIMQDPELYSDGKIKTLEAKISAGIYVSEESFKNSGTSMHTDKIIATYIHEYDHFVTLALQKVPLYLALNYGSSHGKVITGPQRIQDLANKLSNMDISSEEKLQKMILASNSHNLLFYWEKATRILDKEVLSAIGINVRNPWRNLPKLYFAVIMQDPPKIFPLPIEGDPFESLSNREVIHRIIEWENHLQPILNIPYIENMKKSLRDVKVDFITLPALIEEHRKEKAAEELEKSLGENPIK